MPVQPDQLLARIQFAEDHLGPWHDHFADIGLTEPEVDAIKAATNAARAAYTAASAARQASKAATTDYHTATSSMSDLVADAIKKIRLFAQSTNDPTVYGTAEIPPPAAPSPLPPPGAATDISVAIEPDGALTLSWKATAGDGSGAVYLVRRKLAGESNFTIIGAAGTTRGFRTFTDSTLPSGANNIQYIIQGQRGAVIGPNSPLFTITIGSGGGGLVGVASVKMAA